MAQSVEDSEELARFREEWRAEVRRNREARERGRRQSGQHEQQLGGEGQPPDGSAQQQPPHSDVRAAQPQSQARRTSTSGVHSPHTDIGKSSFDPAALPAVVRRALDIYSRAVACEQRSEIDEALRLYRLAFRIYDGVGRIYEQLEHRGFRITITEHVEHRESEAASAEHVPSEAAAATQPVSRTTRSETEQLTQGVEGLTITSPGHKQKTVTDTLADVVSRWPYDLTFEPEDEKQPVHIRRLPDELFAAVFRALDVTTLERFALVCRKARVLTMDVSIWRYVRARILSCKSNGDLQTACDRDLPTTTNTRRRDRRVLGEETHGRSSSDIYRTTTSQARRCLYRGLSLHVCTDRPIYWFETTLNLSC